MIVGQVPMKAVDIVKGQHINEAVDRVGRSEVARYVEVSATITESWVSSTSTLGKVACCTLSTGNALRNVCMP